MKAGFSKVEITPPLGVPLAGYAHALERRARSVRDPLFVRAVALEDEGRLAVLLVFDLLMVNEALYQRLCDALADTRAFLMVHATHTHSSVGGFQKGLLGKSFCGRFSEDMLQNLVWAGEKAVRLALGDLHGCEVMFQSTILPALNGNRRDPNGPKDEEISVIRFHREDRSLVLVRYSAHPVIVAERDHHAISADFPGEVCKLLEKDFAFAVFLQGALGGVDVLFPKDPQMTCEKNLELMAAPIANSARTMARTGRFVRPRMFAGLVEWDLEEPCPSPFPEDTLTHKVLKNVLKNLVPSDVRKARVSAISIGDCVLVGTPADLGVRVSLAIADSAKKMGFMPVVLSQCNGYIGYVHLPEDYALKPEKGFRHMVYYENSMALFGKTQGLRLIEKTQELLKSLASFASVTRP
jgi:hypothetical protein